MEKLAALIDSSEFETTVQPPDRCRARLQVRSWDNTSTLTENIYAAPDADDEWWFWLGWTEQLAPVTEPDQAAQKIMRALRADKIQ